MSKTSQAIDGLIAALIEEHGLDLFEAFLNGPKTQTVVAQLAEPILTDDDKQDADTMSKAVKHEP